MEPETQNPPAKLRPAKLWRRLVMLAVLGVFILIAVLVGVIGYNLVRPIAPPATLAFSSLPEIPTAGLRDARSISVANPATSPTQPITSIAAEQPKIKILELVPEAAQPTAELQARARVINEALARMREAFDKYQQIQKKEPGNPEGDAAFNAWLKDQRMLYRDLDNQVERLIVMLDKDFPASRKRFDSLVLGMWSANGNWAEAANYCSFHGDFEGSIYYCRKMGLMQESLGISIMILREAQNTGEKIHHQMKKTI